MTNKKLKANYKDINIILDRIDANQILINKKIKELREQFNK